MALDKKTDEQEYIQRMTGVLLKEMWNRRTPTSYKIIDPDITFEFLPLEKESEADKLANKKAISAAFRKTQ